MLEFIIKIVGLAIIGWIGYLLYKTKDNTVAQAEEFTLEEGEEIQKTVKGDYWRQEFLWQYSQNRGEFIFTNKRIVFKPIFLLALGRDACIPYSEISSVEKSFVGIFFPVAFTIKTKDGKSYKFAILERQIYIDLINSYIK